MKLSFKINDLATFRYSLTDQANGRSWGGIGWLPREAKMSSTYAQLIAHHTRRLTNTCSERSFKQVLQNHKSALRSFLTLLEKTESSPVGSEFLADFDSTVDRLMASLPSLSDRTKADRRSLLNAWRFSFEELAPDSNNRGREASSAKSPDSLRTPFHRRLKQAFLSAKTTPKAAARAAGISTSAIGRWARGAMPNARTLQDVKKLEPILGIPPGELFSLAANEVPVHSHNAFREALKERTLDEYRLKEPEITPKLRDQWRAFFTYKTAVRPGKLKRHGRGYWNLEHIKDASTKPSSLNSRGQTVSATAEATWGFCASFFGFLQLPVERGGLGYEGHVAQNLAWLVVPEAITAFLEFLTTRSAGIRHGTHRNFCAIVSTMANSKHGYLCQQPDFKLELPEAAIGGRSWSDMCEEACELAGTWKSLSKGQSRNPETPLQYFFEQECPLTPIFDAMGKLHFEASRLAAGAVHEAVLRRDEILLGVLVSNPLRAKNLCTLTYRADNSGNVYKSGAGNWRVRIPGEKFKNRWRTTGTTYDVALPTWLTPLIDDYVRDFRPRLVADNADVGYFFPSSKTGGKISSLGKLVFSLTRRLIPQCGGISSHAFRSLVATYWLKLHPEDYLTVAELLNDTLEVVIKHYAKLKKEDSFSRYEAEVAKARTAFTSR